PASTARTEAACGPLASMSGPRSSDPPSPPLPHAANAPASILHWKPGTATVEVHDNVTCVLVNAAMSGEPMVTTGTGGGASGGGASGGGASGVAASRVPPSAGGAASAVAPSAARASAARASAAAGASGELGASPVVPLSTQTLVRGSQVYPDTQGLLVP